MQPTRRRVLRALGALGLGVLAPELVAARSAMSPTRGPGLDLAPADRSLAALAEGFQAREPARAARICRAVERELGPLARWRASAPRRIELSRQKLLCASRVDAELEAGDVWVLDGWVVSRSEAAFAIYLHGMTRA